MYSHPPQRDECHLRKIGPRAASHLARLVIMHGPTSCVLSWVCTHVMCLRQEPLGCSLALKTVSKEVGLNHSSVLPCAKQCLLTVSLVGDVTNYSLKTCCIVSSQPFSCLLPGSLPMIDSSSADGPSYQTEPGSELPMDLR